MIGVVWDGWERWEGSLELLCRFREHRFGSAPGVHRY